MQLGRELWPQQGEIPRPASGRGTSPDARVTLVRAEQRPDGSVEAILALEFELEGGSKPVCVAESVFRYIPSSE